MDVLSHSDPFVQFTVTPSNLKGKKKAHASKNAFLSSLWKSNTYTIQDCPDPVYQCCCMLFLGNINEQVSFLFLAIEGERDGALNLTNPPV